MHVHGCDAMWNNSLLAAHALPCFTVNAAAGCGCGPVCACVRAFLLLVVGAVSPLNRHLFKYILTFNVNNNTQQLDTAKTN